MQGINRILAPAVKVRFERFQNTAFEYCYSRLDGVPNEYTQGVSGGIRRVVCKREQEQWTGMNALIWNQCTLLGDQCFARNDDEPGLNDTSSWTAVPNAAELNELFE